MEKRLLTRRVIVWSIGIAQVILFIECGVFYLWSGDWFAAELAIAGLIAFALVGALIASQQVNFRFGWFLLLTPVPALVSFMASQYGDLIQSHRVDLLFKSSV